MLRFLHNWSWNEVEYAVPTAAQDLLSGTELAAGQAISLAAWDARILVEQAA